MRPFSMPVGVVFGSLFVLIVSSSPTSNNDAFGAVNLLKRYDGIPSPCDMEFDRNGETSCNDYCSQVEGTCKKKRLGGWKCKCKGCGESFSHYSDCADVCKGTIGYTAQCDPFRGKYQCDCYRKPPPTQGGGVLGAPLYQEEAQPPSYGTSSDQPPNYEQGYSKD
ncbi:Uu.00g057180.m01.CDS01 [Anthostomella pinea]|uniref:Uu.00g057180.m01.CDS01 n=1 Tax=Anthostomella pinea TaxID=933095 RepID=A0AAI8VRP3_9PEZI|nr:Uu.00g057180.m01.CDS01 [Anthostomella pinea]